MKFFTQTTKNKKEKIFLFQYNRYENGYIDIYFRLFNLNFLLYPSKYNIKLKEGLKAHKTIKF